MDPSPAAPGAPGLSTIGQIALSVADADRAVSFYRDRLGLKPLFQFPGLAFFDCGGVRLMLSASDKHVPTDANALYFRVRDIRTAHRELSRREVPFEGEPHIVARMPDHNLWMAFFRDPDRNLLALMSEEPRGGDP